MWGAGIRVYGGGGSGKLNPPPPGAAWDKSNQPPGKSRVFVFIMECRVCRERPSSCKSRRGPMGVDSPVGASRVYFVLPAS